MVETDNRYYECPKCGWAIRFKFKGDKYVSMCPYCKYKLEIDREEYEEERESFIPFTPEKRGE